METFRYSLIALEGEELDIAGLFRDIVAQLKELASSLLEDGEQLPPELKKSIEELEVVIPFKEYIYKKGVIDEKFDYFIENLLINIDNSGLSDKDKQVVKEMIFTKVKKV